MPHIFKFMVLVNGDHRVWSFEVTARGTYVTGPDGEFVEFVAGEALEAGAHRVSTFIEPMWAFHGQNYHVQFSHFTRSDGYTLASANWLDLDNGEYGSIITAEEFEEEMAKLS